MCEKHVGNTAWDRAVCLSPHVHTTVFSIPVSLGMDGIFHKAGKVGMDYDCVCSAINKMWPVRIRSLTVMGNKLDTLYSAFFHLHSNTVELFVASVTL